MCETPRKSDERRLTDIHYCCKFQSKSDQFESLMESVVMSGYFVSVDLSKFWHQHHVVRDTIIDLLYLTNYQSESTMQKYVQHRHI